jgi:hypothetical protein
MNRKIIFGVTWAVTALLLAGCSQNSSRQTTELASFPLNDMSGIISRSGIQIDKEISSDGKGSLKITSQGFQVVRLFETGDLDMDSCRLIYQARLRTQDFEGGVFLGMECHFAGKGDFFARDVEHPLTGTTRWTTEEVTFYLRQGENPDNVRLHLILDGKGTVWIDDVKLLKAPLQ